MENTCKNCVHNKLVNNSISPGGNIISQTFVCQNWNSPIFNNNTVKHSLNGRILDGREDYSCSKHELLT